jgi:hypothetical protein
VNLSAAPSYLSPRARLDWVRQQQGGMVAIIAFSEPPGGYGYALSASGTSWWLRVHKQKSKRHIRKLKKAGIGYVVIDRTEKPEYSIRRMLELLGPLAKYARQPAIEFSYHLNSRRSVVAAPPATSRAPRRADVRPTKRAKPRRSSDKPMPLFGYSRETPRGARIRRNRRELSPLLELRGTFRPLLGRQEPKR